MKAAPGRGGNRRGGARSLGSLIEGLVKKGSAARGAAPGPAVGIAREVIEAAWRRAVGPEIAAQSAVRGLARGVLEVEVESAALLQELATFYRRDILAALKGRGAALADVTELRLRLGGAAAASRPSEVPGQSARRGSE